MTTRRELLTGLAALPISAASGSTAEAALPEEPAESAPFWNYMDGQLWRELSYLETTLDRVKEQLIAANRVHPVTRSGALFEMRCTFQALMMHAQWASEVVETQRVQADRAAKEWKENHPEKYAQT
ncbi:hypothetical protein [Aureimonas psammosilenae]|uniref:hypothetical protein n=1 Tax=Aureimonas psammosilenae TaxID=2495496 RepID=UPI001260977B|nr:hypothetical protein [Aureimonas psammosilenae]